MDPTVFVNILVAFLTPGVSEAGKDAYVKLKSVLSRRFGRVAQAVEALERNPRSEPLQEKVKKEVANTGAAQDGEVCSHLNFLEQVNSYNLVQAQQYGNNVSSHQQIGRGDGIQQIGSHNILTRNNHPLPFIIAFIIPGIIIIIIIVYAILQVAPKGFPSITLNPPVPITPTPTYPELPPRETINDICIIQANPMFQFGFQLVYEKSTTQKYQSEVSLQEFANEWLYHEACVLSNVKTSGDTATGNLLLKKPTKSSKYTVIFKKELTSDSNGNPAYVWLIDQMKPE